MSLKTLLMTEESLDLIHETAVSLESIGEEEAANLVPSLMDESDFSLFKLGGVLAVMQSNGWTYGYSSFKEAIEAKFGIKYRKAMYLISIYENLVKNQIPWSKVSGLGWSKLKELAPYLTPENVDWMVEKVKDMTVLQIREYLKMLKEEDAVESLGKESGEESGEPVTSAVSTMTFKVHPDQKETILAAINKAKGEVNTEYSTVALEAICVGYLGGSVSINQNELAGAALNADNLADVFKKVGYKEVLLAFEKAFPDIDLEVTINRPGF